MKRAQVLRLAALAAAAGALTHACGLAPISYVGKQCPTGECPLSLVCVAGVCELTGDVDGGGGGVGGGGAGGGVATGGGTGGGGAATGGGTDGGRAFIVVQVAGPADDALWCGTDEMLTTTDHSLEVGPGNTSVMGARFALPLPRGAVLEDVHYSVSRTTGPAGSIILNVRAWDSINVPPFDDTHVHPAEVHGGTFLAGSGTLDSDWHPTPTSSDLSGLLQPLINRADWTPGSVIGLAVLADPAEPLWAGFDDYTTLNRDAGAVISQLTVLYHW